MKVSTSALATAALVAGVSAAPVEIEQRSVLSGYDPNLVVCPSTSLNRVAKGTSQAESAYLAARQTKAAAALASWLKSIDSTFNTTVTPVVGLTSSGGGLRALLNGAGVVQGFDARDTSAKTGGVYQGLSYHAGLSGGAWLLSSIAGNNWPTVSSLKTGLWETAFQDSIFDPDGILFGAAYTAVVNDVVAKSAEGYAPSLVDPWGRLLSYQLLYGIDGGVNDRLSGLASGANFTAHNVPFPIMTALGLDLTTGKCAPLPNTTQYEFTPYEFGSWDQGIRAFTNSAYLGTAQSNNKPVNPLTCVTNYDNLGYVFGTSSNVFGEICELVTPDNSSLSGFLESIVADAKAPAYQDTFALYSNPWYKSSTSPLVSALPTLNLADGGIGGQNNPIWPLIQPERNVSVLIVSDQSADTSDNFPDGSQIYNTYVQAKADGLTKMPVIPNNTTFVAKGLNKRATFFGCNDPNAITIVYLPNVAYSYASNTATLDLQYSKNQTDGIIGNGVNIATQNGDSQWPLCLACAFQKKTGTTLPSGCQACFTKYCYSG